MATVTNSLDVEGSYTTSLRALHWPEADILRFPYNPESWQTTVSSKWRPRKALGVRTDRLDWEGNPPVALRFKHKLVPVGHVSAGANGVLVVDQAKLLEAERVLQVIANWAVTPTDLTGEPTKVLLSFGTHVYECSIMKWDWTVLQSDRDGNSIQADVNLELVENPRGL